MVPKIIIAALVLAVAGAAFIIFFNNPFAKEAPAPDTMPTEPPSTQGETITTPPPSENISPVEPPAPSLEEQTASFRQTIADVSATGESQEVTLVFTEADVNAQAARILTQVEIPEDIPLEIKSVRIDLQADNNLLMEAETAILGFGATLEARAQVSTKEGEPDIAITDVGFGSIPIPGTLKDQIVTFITQKMDEILVQMTESAVGGQEIDLEFKDINVQEEKVTITVIVKKVN